MSNKNEEKNIEKCTSCGVPFEDHMGIIETCAENLKLKLEMEELRENINAWWSLGAKVKGKENK